MLPHLSTNFEILKCYHNEPKFTKNTIPKIKDGANTINLDEYKLIGAHWIDFYVNGDNNILW